MTNHDYRDFAAPEADLKKYEIVELDERGERHSRMQEKVSRVGSLFACRFSFCPEFWGPYCRLVYSTARLIVTVTSYSLND